MPSAYKDKERQMSHIIHRMFLFAAVAVLAACAVKEHHNASRATAVDLQQLSTNDAIFAHATHDPYELAFRAYIWGMPLVDWAKVRLFQTRPQDPFSERPGSNAGAAINRFGKARELYGPHSIDGVGVNNDTLYSIASFDTDAGPFVIETPEFGSRYYTFTVYMGDTASRLSPGQRTHGGKLPPMFLYGRNYRGDVPAGMLPIPADTRYVLIAGRILVDGSPADLARVHRLQDRIRVRTLDAYLRQLDQDPPVSEQRLLAPDRYLQDPDLQFMAQLGDVLRDWQVRDQEADLIASFNAIGLTAERGFDASLITADLLAEIRRGVADARTLVERESKRLGVQANGWTTNYSGADFKGDYLLRAAVAKDQIGVSIAEEAVYPIGRLDSDGNVLDGQHRYRIVLDRNDLPPVDAFWSITLYDDRGIMVANPLERYSVGDRTADLVTDRNGNIVIALQAEKPEDATVNWLPAPAAPFYLMMRLYQPRAAVFNGEWQPPAIERVP